MEGNEPFKILEIDLEKKVVRTNRPPKNMEETLMMENAVKDVIVRSMIEEGDHIIYDN